MSAAVLFVTFAVWPIVAFAGGLAYAPLAGLAALIISPVSLPRMQIRFYMLVILAFFAYAAATMLWSPKPAGLVSGSLVAGSFAVRSEILRVGLALLAGGALILAARSLDDRSRDQLNRVVTIALLVQLTSIVVLTAFERQAISIFYGSRPDDEGVQNISRNCQIMVFAAPFLILGLARGRSLRVTILIAVAVVGALTAVALIRGVDVGLLTFVLTGAFMTTVSVFRRHGFRIIGVLIASVIMTAPLTAQFLSRGASSATATNSVEYRQVIWQRVLTVIDDNPVFGSGVGVLRTKREKIPDGMFADLYYIPNHAHNMLLQLWAETGALGAFLLSAAVIFAAFRLPRPELLGLSSLRIAALVGGMTAAWVSFDLWNEWWWTVGCLLAVPVAGSPRAGLEPIGKARPHDDRQRSKS